jgi:hypothetical protein
MMLTDETGFARCELAKCSIIRKQGVKIVIGQKACLVLGHVA